MEPLYCVPQLLPLPPRYNNSLDVNAALTALPAAAIPVVKLSLVSNFNFYLNNFNFIGPYGTEYFTSYSPKLTAGPISSIGAVISWIFTDNIYIIRFANFIYLFLLSILLLCIVLFAFNFEIKRNLILLTTLFLFSLTNTSWWYGILYLLPETICALIFANAILLFDDYNFLNQEGVKAAVLESEINIKRSIQTQGGQLICFT